MIDVELRQAKESALTPAARQMGNHISPMAITLAAGIIGVLAALAALQGVYVLGLVLWLMNRVLDGLDGTVARTSGQQSDIGGYVDLLIDFVIYTIIPAALAFRQPHMNILIALVFLFGTFYVNAAALLYLSALLERLRQGAKERGEKTSITLPRGLIEGTETILFYSLFFLFPDALGILFLILGSLVMITIVQRVVWAVHSLPDFQSGRR